MQPTISILVPTYRRVEKLRRALESVATAVSASYEVIVVDDCPDGSGFEAARQFGCRYVHKAGVDRGQSFSRNIALDLARGHWIAFLDDDDFFLSGGLDNLLERAASTPCGMVFGDYQSFNTTTRIEVSLAQVDWNSLLVCNQIPMGAFAIARHTVQRNFDTRMRSHEDWDFLLSNTSIDGMSYVSRIVVAIDKTDNQTTSTEARRRRLFWLDFLSIYARFPASHLAPAREAMLASIGVQFPPGLLQIEDVI